jgi:anti-sigma B factor antagonist
MGTHGRIICLTLEGELDAVSVAATRRRLLNAVRSNPGSAIHADMSRVPFMDSRGLGALVGAYKQAIALGGTFHVVRPHERVAELLTLTTLDRIFLAPASELADGRSSRRDEHRAS